MLDVQFMSSSDQLLDVPYLNVGIMAKNDSVIGTRVLVTQAGDPIMTINVWTRNGNPNAKDHVLLWNNWIVIAFWAQVTFVHAANHTTTTIQLEGYFGNLYPMGDRLLVTSAVCIHCFGIDGQLLWVSEALGIDGVVIEQIQDGRVMGVGE